MGVGLLRRVVLGAAGSVLIGVGLALAFLLLPSAATAQPNGDTNAPEVHATMDRMMDAVHGEAISERMHQVEGAEQMMDAGSRMMGSMGQMNKMMQMSDGVAGTMNPAGP